MTRTAQRSSLRERFLGDLLRMVVVVGGLVWAVGQVAELNGGDFLQIAWQPNQHLLAGRPIPLDYPYPLWTPVLMLPFTLGSFALGNTLWLCLNVVLLAASLVLLAHLLGWRRAWIGPVLGLLTVSMLPVLTSMALGQVVFVILIALIGCLWALREQRWFMAGTLLGVMLIKPQTLVLVVGLVLLLAVLQRRWHLLAGFGMVAGGLVALAAPFASTPRQIIGGGIAGHLTTYLGNTSTLWGLLLTVFTPRFREPVMLGLLISTLLLGWVLWQWWRARVIPLEHPRIGGLIIIATVVNLVIVPYSWMHNLALLVVPCAYLLKETLRLTHYWSLGIIVTLGLVMYPITWLLYLGLTQQVKSQAYQVIPALILLPLLVLVFGNGLRLQVIKQ